MRALRALLPLLVALGPAGAATLEKLTLDEMIQKSTAIVRGRVQSGRAVAHGPMIYTHWRVQVLEQWKGAAATEVEVITPGGTLGGLEQNFSGSPTLAPSSEYVLFLWTGRNRLTHVIGLSQGLFDVAKDAAGALTVQRAASRETMLDPRTGLTVDDQPVLMRLSEMTRRIRTRLAVVK